MQHRDNDFKLFICSCFISSSRVSCPFPLVVVFFSSFFPLFLCPASLPCPWLSPSSSSARFLRHAAEDVVPTPAHSPSAPRGSWALRSWWQHRLVYLPPDSASLFRLHLYQWNYPLYHSAMIYPPSYVCQK